MTACQLDIQSAMPVRDRLNTTWNAPNARRRHGGHRRNKLTSGCRFFLSRIDGHSLMKHCRIVSCVYMPSKETAGSAHAIVLRHANNHRLSAWMLVVEVTFHSYNPQGKSLTPTKYTQGLTLLPVDKALYKSTTIPWCKIAHISVQIASNFSSNPSEWISVALTALHINRKIRMYQ